ncbi:cyclic nucleotide-binding domain-containing protein [Asticcacaulis sp. BYS171W]|uniref:Cyclic nucleotide-binding domain-containing protein n=1 Tax=Asticcacaulis aquaticus TaxID=2984212 RepID=A0ABT5HWM5_9CAUL|nr:cyclic nucleotide-binding domain-containing protein [Asticcacaulis aquaticus]MDC7684479.1 cyclic nucleotide-binding domain-containing protein [Asticcacaulis aquaticus]
MREADANRIRSLQLFASMQSERFGALTRGALLQTFPANGNLIYEADNVDYLYILLDGSVELQGRWHDKESTLAVLRPVSTFILAAVVLDAPALMSARTLEKSQVAMLPAEHFRAAMREDAAFAVAVAQELSGCYRGLVRTIKNHKLRSGNERLANYLLTQQIRQGGDTTIELPHEKRILASLLDLTPESLSRAFASLAKYDVEVTGSRVSIGNPAGLRRLARPNALIDNHALPKGVAQGKADKELWPLRNDRGCGAEVE